MWKFALRGPSLVAYAALGVAVALSWYGCLGDEWLIRVRTLTPDRLSLVAFLSVMALVAVSSCSLAYARSRRAIARFGGGDVLVGCAVGALWGALSVFIPYWANYAFATGEPRWAEVDVEAVYAVVGGEGGVGRSVEKVEVDFVFEGHKYFLRQKPSFFYVYFTADVCDSIREIERMAASGRSGGIMKDGFSSGQPVRVVDGALGYPFLVGQGEE